MPKDHYTAMTRALSFGDTQAEAKGAGAAPSIRHPGSRLRRVADPLPPMAASRVASTSKYLARWQTIS